VCNLRKQMGISTPHTYHAVCPDNKRTRRNKTYWTLAKRTVAPTAKNFRCLDVGMRPDLIYLN